MRKTCLSCSLVLLVTAAAALAGQEKAPIIVPNTLVTKLFTTQSVEPNVIRLRDGGWLVTWLIGPNHSDDGDANTDGLWRWLSIVQFGSDWGIYQQRYAASGTKVGSEIQVKTYDNQSSAVATALTDGGWLVTSDSNGQSWGGWLATWLSTGHGSSDSLYQQRYAASGDKEGAQTQVYSITTGDQDDPAVTALADGGWVVAWLNQDQNVSGGGVYQQRFAASGAKVGVEMQVNSYASTTSKYRPAISALKDGGWVVTWAIYDQGGPEWSIYQQRYTAAGAKVGIEAKVNTVRSYNGVAAAVTELADGGWLVTWMSYSKDGSDWDIYQQRYAASNAKLGLNTQVNTYATESQSYPAVALLGDGGWLVTWSSYGQDGSGEGVYQQRYAASGAKVGIETQVNTDTKGHQSSPDVTALSDGGWVVTWNSRDEDGSGYGIHQQRYDAVGNPVGG